MPKRVKAQCQACSLAYTSLRRGEVTLAYRVGARLVTFKVPDLCGDCARNAGKTLLRSESLRGLTLEAVEPRRRKGLEGPQHERVRKVGD